MADSAASEARTPDPALALAARGVEEANQYRRPATDADLTTDDLERFLSVMMEKDGRPSGRIV